MEENTPAPDVDAESSSLLMANGLIESCFEQTRRCSSPSARRNWRRAARFIRRVVRRHFALDRHQQTDGTAGSAVRALVLDRTTGEEIRPKQLFSDADAAFDAMETIIENDVVVCS